MADSRVSVGSSQERGGVGGREELGGQEVPSVALCPGLPTEPPLSSLGVLPALAQFLARHEMLEKPQDAMVARVGFHRLGGAQCGFFTS